MSSWAERNHNHSVLGQISTFVPINLPQRRHNVTGRKATRPHPFWTVALLKIKTLLLGMYHNTMAWVMWYTRECDAFILKQSWRPLAQALNIFTMMNSSDLSFLQRMGLTWLKADTFLDYCDENLEHCY